MGAVADNLAQVRAAMVRAAQRAGRDPQSVRLIAVSKIKPAALIREAVAAGQHDFGENYAQELRDKMAELADLPARWHFIGKLQRNKVKYVAGKVELLHTLEGAKLAAEVSSRSIALWTKTRALLEVNLGAEATKAGTSLDEARALARAALGMAGIELAGLMAMPPYGDAAEASRPYFRELRELRDRLEQELGVALPELSMGLSHDFEVAIEEGATLVRVGTAIFGTR